MLSLRIATALVLIPLVVWGVLALPTERVAWVWGALLVLGAWEWATLAGLTRLWSRLLWLAAFACLLAGALVARENPLLLIGSALAAGFWWLHALARVAGFRGDAAAMPAKAYGIAAGLLVLVPPALALAWLHGNGASGPQHVLFLLVLVWTADSAAYFAGRRFGRTKLAPAVSPGKTREGLWGAMVASAAVAAGGTYVLPVEADQLPGFLAVCIVAVLASVLGDLNESLFKRVAGVKDSGRLFPGHGGVLDRIDSLTAALPVYAVGLFAVQGATA